MAAEMVTKGRCERKSGKKLRDVGSNAAVLSIRTGAGTDPSSQGEKRAEKVTSSARKPGPPSHGSRKKAGSEFLKKAKDSKKTKGGSRIPGGLLERTQVNFDAMTIPKNRCGKQEKSRTFVRTGSL